MVRMKKRFLYLFYWDIRWILVQSEKRESGTELASRGHTIGQHWVEKYLEADKVYKQIMKHRKNPDIACIEKLKGM